MAGPDGGWGGRARAFLRSYRTPAGRQALRNLVGLVLCTGVSQACALGTLLILTHGLSPGAFGAVIFALNVQPYLVTVGTFGLTTIVVRDLAQLPDRVDETVTAYLAVVGTMSVVAGVLAAGVAAAAPLSDDERLMVWCVAAGCVPACLNLTPLFDAFHRQARGAALTVPGDLLAVAALAGLWAADRLTVASFAAALLGKTCVAAVAHLYAFRAGVHRTAWRLRGDRVRGMMRAGWPMMAAGLLYAIPMGGSVVLVRAVAGPEWTAVYGLAFQVVAMELLAVALLIRVLQPHISGPGGTDPRFVTQVVGVLVAALVVLVAGCVAAGWVLFNHALPAVYRLGYQILIILQGFVACYAAAATVNLYLLRTHRVWWIGVAHVVAVGGYLATLAAGVWRYDFGFAWATIASTAGLLVLGLCGCRLRVRGTDASTGRVT